MGMAQAYEPRVKKPTYYGNVVCQNCGTEYSPGQWSRGKFIGEGTETPVFEKYSNVPDGCCPACLAKAT